MPLRSLAVDFNAFFASCEQQDRPELRGHPVAIVPVLAETTSCIAANYLAKACGVRTGTRIAEARQLCPEIRLIAQRPRLYIDYSRQLRAIIESCIHITSVRSIDEVECDLTATFAPREKALSVAREIKTRIGQEIGPCLTSSIGIAPNWLLAKLATDLQKPDGLVVIDDDDLPQKLLGLKLQDFLGVGAAMEARLRAHGIDTAEQFYAASPALLRGIWGGVEGERMHARLHGAAIPLPPPKKQTIGHSHVLPPTLRTVPRAHAVLHRLLQKAAMRLRQSGHYAGALSLSLDYYDEVSWSDELRCTETQDTLQLTQALNQLWARRPVALRARAPFRVGLVLTRLLPWSAHTPDLFHQARDTARAQLHQAMDTLNQTFGHGSVYFGGAHGVQAAAPMRISFTCIPEPELEEIDPQRARRLRPLTSPHPLQDSLS